MGTCLSAAIQLYYEATADGRRESWDTVAVFEFNKDYSLSMHLSDLQPSSWLHDDPRARTDEWWPHEAREYGCNRQTFKAAELPTDIEKIYEPGELAEGWGPRYLALLDVCARLGVSRTRVLFWRDQ